MSVDKVGYPMRGGTNSAKIQKQKATMTNADPNKIQGKKSSKEHMGKGRDEMSPVTREGQFNVYDKRA